MLVCCSADTAGAVVLLGWYCWCCCVAHLILLVLIAILLQTVESVGVHMLVLKSVLILFVLIAILQLTVESAGVHMLVLQSVLILLVLIAILHPTVESAGVDAAITAEIYINLHFKNKNSSHIFVMHCSLTQNHTPLLNTPQFNHSKTQNCYFYQVITIWNSLPNSLKNCTFKLTFKKHYLHSLGCWIEILVMSKLSMSTSPN